MRETRKGFTWDPGWTAVIYTIPPTWVQLWNDVHVMIVNQIKNKRLYMGEANAIRLEGQLGSNQSFNQS